MVHFQKYIHHISYIVYFFPSRSVTECLSTGALFLLCTFLLPSAKYAADCDRSTVNSLIYIASQIETFSSKLAPKRRGQCSLGDAVRSTTSGWTQLARALLRNLTLESSAGGCHLVTWPLARLARRLQGRTSPLPWGSLSLLWRAPVLTKPPGCVAVVVHVRRRRILRTCKKLWPRLQKWKELRLKWQAAC